MFKDNRYIYAGTTEIYRFGHKAVEKAEKALEANEKGFYSIPVDGGKYWTIGTSEGKYGEYAKVGDTFFSVNKGGYMWAKAGTGKGEAFVKAVKAMIEYMNKLNAARVQAFDDNEEEEI